ncbi:hypothetical protein H9L10_05030 [Phycicoccus endophyticus]|uniref:Uncharacterized protein n=1 Tax=Phycicoccus endophyticus TaxID=1690220 RepID=A0A7G9R460_9MICO|nr:hypothetical protein [Phycicoccus endophyticus]NHI18232.1 hypothetical protein [Phycicoccus endophyticus]QNN50385.1 hypothetical protein H9L10_05030 [Phycicoccus endophyticus]GGL25322.1 hypothetical protein GCM10012283_04430 [Phycicoccus endophyticus]
MRPAGAAAGVLAAVVTTGAHRALVARVRSRRWERTNHAGRTVTLLEGPAFVAGAAAGATLGGAPGLLAAVGAGAFGALDDLAGDSGSKGLKGHLGAAARGELTTGAVKIAGLGLTGLAAAALADRGRGEASTLDTLVGAGVVAGSANLANLLDLRPGRALKATALAGTPIALGGGAGAASAGAAVGAALAALGPDLAGRSMLGDTGANAAGALVGVALVHGCGRRGRLGALAVLVATTLVSERVSFTAVIESTPVLRELDAWGRGGR